MFTSYFLLSRGNRRYQDRIEHQRIFDAMDIMIFFAAKKINMLFRKSMYSLNTILF
ncbi:hypothetical protein CHELA1G11_20289 [Hyphomicrobiales bacterium]|nr:hypothetical protein CHELA1G11_20289 [Hyphomicrobiales bacterium]CAH1689475.1 hypothetical protein CHELA1G2_20604 [Hyphomicrobiales bacterium]